MVTSQFDLHLVMIRMSTLHAHYTVMIEIHRLQVWLVHVDVIQYEIGQHEEQQSKPAVYASEAGYALC